LFISVGTQAARGVAGDAKELFDVQNWIREFWRMKNHNPDFDLGRQHNPWIL